MQRSCTILAKPYHINKIHTNHKTQHLCKVSRSYCITDAHHICVCALRVQYGSKIVQVAVVYLTAWSVKVALLYKRRLALESPHQPTEGLLLHCYDSAFSQHFFQPDGQQPQRRTWMKRWCLQWHSTACQTKTLYCLQILVFITKDFYKQAVIMGSLD